MSDHTPEPWRWGFWKWHDRGDTSYSEFLPVSEMAPWDVLALAHCDYGYRVGSRSNLPTVIEGEGGDDGESATVSISDADMALVAASPTLLAACIRARDLLRGGDGATFKARACLDSAIKESQREAT